jgi:ribose transport system substrate-binding protein
MRFKWRARSFAALGLVLVVGIATAGCGSDSGSSSGGGKKKVGVLLFSRGFEFMVALDQGIRNEAKAKGLDVVVLDGKGDTNTQLSQIDDQIASGAGGLIVSPNNSSEIVPGISKANEAKVPLVTTDAIAAGGDVAAHVGFNNEEGGKVAAQEMCKLVKGKGTVLELTGALGEYHAVNRQKGFDSEIKSSCPNVKVLVRNADWDADKALSLTVDNLTKNKDIAGIYTHNDEMVRGVISGLQQVGKNAKAGESGHVAIVGIDGTPTALDRIRKGIQDATVQQDPFVMGKDAVDQLAASMDGGSPTKMTQLPPTLVTKKNAGDPELWGNKFHQ